MDIYDLKLEKNDFLPIRKKGDFYECSLLRCYCVSD